MGATISDGVLLIRGQQRSSQANSLDEINDYARTPGPDSFRNLSHKLNSSALCVLFLPGRRRHRVRNHCHHTSGIAVHDSCRRIRLLFFPNVDAIGLPNNITATTPTLRYVSQTAILRREGFTRCAGDHTFERSELRLSTNACRTDSPFICRASDHGHGVGTRLGSFSGPVIRSRCLKTSPSKDYSSGSSPQLD
jgi:hypothetical protein